MKSLQEWITHLKTRYPLSSDNTRLFLAIVIAFLTRMIVQFVLVDLTGWIPEESLGEIVPIFIWYFLFCVYYSLLCQVAFGKLETGELRTLLKRDKPQSEDSLIAFLSGESGTSHATMFSIVALVGVGAITIAADSSNDQTHLLLLQISGLLTIIGSWVSNVASFALQYAREDTKADECGFRFPDNVQPVWSDYVYTAIMISTTLSSADVNVMTRSRRKLVSIHTVIAFTFNTVIIAMLVAAIT